MSFLLSIILSVDCIATEKEFTARQLLPSSKVVTSEDRVIVQEYLHFLPFLSTCVFHQSL